MYVEGKNVFWIYVHFRSEATFSLLNSEINICNSDVTDFESVMLSLFRGHGDTLQRSSRSCVLGLFACNFL
jgi:hypothetical protein